MNECGNLREITIKTKVSKMRNTNIIDTSFVGSLKFVYSSEPNAFLINTINMTTSYFKINVSI